MRARFHALLAALESGGVSREVPPYPHVRSEPWFESYAREAIGALRRSSPRASVQCWMTDDRFDAVRSFYTGCGTERPEFAKAFLPNLKAQCGCDVSATYVIFDAASSPLKSKHYISIQRPVIVSFQPLEVHDVTQIMLFRQTPSLSARIWSALFGSRSGGRQHAAIEHTDQRGTRDRRASDAGKWSIQSSGTTEGIAWRLFVDPALENPDGRKAPDAIWWTTNAVNADAFVAVMGYAGAHRLDWRGQGGVRQYEDIEVAANAIVDEIEGADFAGDLVELEARTLHANPWMSIDRFLESARDVALHDHRVRDVQIRMTDPEMASHLCSERVIAALEQVKPLVNDSEAFLRIWLGAPDLRINLASVIDDEAIRPMVFERLTELGVAIAVSYHSVVRDS